jgi:hypothetical protein
MRTARALYALDRHLRATTESRELNILQEPMCINPGIC